MRACVALRAALPQQLGNQLQRRIEPPSELTAAWGDPAIVLRCDVPTPAAYTPTAQLVTVNGIRWFSEQLSNGYAFTTVGRVANVEVTIPRRYAPEVNPLVDLAEPIERTLIRVE